MWLQGRFARAATGRRRFLLDSRDYFGLRGDELRVYGTRLMDSIAEYVAVDVYEPFGRPAYYLPADRTGIMHAYKAVVGAVLNNVAMAAIRDVGRTPMLSGVLADFLEGLIALDNASPFRTRSTKRKEILEICVDNKRRAYWKAPYLLNLRRP